MLSAEYEKAQQKRKTIAAVLAMLYGGSWLSGYSVPGQEIVIDIALFPLEPFGLTNFYTYRVVIQLWALLLGSVACYFVVLGILRLLVLFLGGVSSMENKVFDKTPKRQCPHDSTISYNAHICPFCRLDVSFTPKPEEK